MEGSRKSQLKARSGEQREIDDVATVPRSPSRLNTRAWLV